MTDKRHSSMMRGPVKDWGLRALVYRGLFGFCAVWMVIVAIALAASGLIGAR